MTRHTIIIAICTALSLIIGTKKSAAQTTERQMKMAQMMEAISHAFIETQIAYVDTIELDRQLNDIMHGMMKSLDPYSEYIEPEDTDDFEMSVTGKYGGIGALIRQRDKGGVRWTEISEPYLGTPSDKAGLKAGDVLLEIDGKSLKGLGSVKVVEMLKGDPNTSFTLKYRPLSDTTTTKTVTIVRERISLPAVPYYGIVADSVGYISLNSFTEDCTLEIENALKEMIQKNGITSVIIDLRSNGGGIIGEAVDMVNLFTPQNTTVVEVKGKSKKLNQTYKTQNKAVAPKIRIATLINSSSASASEIFAGAMQDLDRGVVLGQRSFGKGLVQTTERLPNKGLLKLTIARYYTPSGRCIQALNYNQKDNSADKIPDSLIQTFTTLNGRKVYDGGGITPDLVLENEYISKFSALLYANGLIDDFANLYAAQNPDTTQKFVLTNQIYDQFTEFMQTHNVKFESLTAMKLDEIKKAAKSEKYDTIINTEIEKIAGKIKDDKNAELLKNKEEIKEMLTQSILTRLYYQHKAIEHRVKDDKSVKKAIEILQNPKEYNRILKEQDTEKKPKSKTKITNT